MFCGFLDFFFFFLVFTTNTAPGDDGGTFGAFGSRGLRSDAYRLIIAIASVISSERRWCPSFSASSRATSNVEIIAPVFLYIRIKVKNKVRTHEYYPRKKKYNTNYIDTMKIYAYICVRRFYFNKLSILWKICCSLFFFSISHYPCLLPGPSIRYNLRRMKLQKIKDSNSMQDHFLYGLIAVCSGGIVGSIFIFFIIH